MEELNLIKVVSDIYNYLIPIIDWMVFILVIAIGYLVRGANLLPKWSNTLKIFVFSFVVTLSYSYFSEVNMGKFIASYFLAFGFHSAILKIIERKISNSKISNIFSHVGNRPGDR